VPPLLQENYRKDLTLAEAEVLALTTLKQVMEEKVTATNVDIARVAPAWHMYSPEEVDAVIARL
jgi:20S proteasome subunit alpha 5